MKKTVKITILVLAVLIAAGATAVYLSSSKKPSYEFFVVKRGELTKEINITGKVKPVETVELSFEKSGEIAEVETKVGEKVKTGQILARLENSELQAKLYQAEAGFEAQKAALEELEKGARPEEIQLAQTKVSNAERAIEDARTNLINVKNKAEADLTELYQAALYGLNDSLNAGENAVFALTDIQYAHFVGYDKESAQIASAKADAVLLLLGQEGAGRWSNDAISGLTGGIKAAVLQIQSNPVFENIDKTLVEMQGALEKIRTALASVPLSSVLTSTEQTTLETQKDAINNELAETSANLQAITVQKAANQKAISSAEASLNESQNSLDLAQAELNLKKAPATQEQIASQEAKVKEAKANVQSFEAQLAKTILRSPINGLVTRQTAKVGEIITAQNPLISLISEAEFELEAYVPEVDIAEIEVGDAASTTLDAYGDDVVFKTTVASIEPAETLIEGVVYYKITVVFEGRDTRIKSGMSADIIIETAKKENTLFVPYRAVIYKEGKKIVRILRGKEIAEIEVATGLKSSQGEIEITEGLNEGDKVIVFIKQ